MEQQYISVATVNAREGDFIRSPRLRQFPAIDVLLLQEVEEDRDNLNYRLHRELGMYCVASSDTMKTAIAISERVTPIETWEEIYDPCSVLGAFMLRNLDESSSRRRHFRERGLLGAGLRLTTHSGDHDLTAVTSHLMVPSRPRTRAKHLRRIMPLLKHTEGPVIFGGDMNSWPSPRAADLELQHELDMERADIGTQATWHAHKSNNMQKYLARFAPVDAQMDAILFRGFSSSRPSASYVVDIDSDHNAVVTHIPL